MYIQGKKHWHEIKIKEKNENILKAVVYNSMASGESCYKTIEQHWEDTDIPKPLELICYLSYSSRCL